MEPIDVLRSWAVQDSPPGAAIAAVVARVPGRAGGLARHYEAPVVALYNPRTATAIVPEDEVAAYGTALLPPDDAALKAIVDTRAAGARRGLRRARRSSPSTRSRTRWTAGAQPRRPARAAATEAAGRAAAVVRGLPEPPRAARAAGRWRGSTGGCASPAARGASRRSRAPTSSSAGTRRRARRPGAELVRRYRRTYGAPRRRRTSPTGPASAARTRARCGSSVRRRAAPPDVSTACACSRPGDPMLLGRDREALLPDAAARKKVWAALGGMGIVLADGEPVALWRGRKKGKRLEVAVESAGERLPKREIEAQLERLAPHRGCTSVVRVVSLTGRYARPDATRRDHRLGQRQRQDHARARAGASHGRRVRRARRARPRPELDRDARRRAARDVEPIVARRRLGDRRRLRAQARQAGARRRRHDRLARPADRASGCRA